MPTTNQETTTKERSVVTFDPDSVMPTCMHGWNESLAAMEALEPIITSQMGLLTDPSVKKYDVVRIIDGDRLIKLERNGAFWDTDATDKEIRNAHNFLRLWASGGLEGKTMFEAPQRHEPTDDMTFTGTPIECEAWLRKRFDVMRWAIVGYTSEQDGNGYVPGERQDEMLDLYERSVWKVTVNSLDMVAESRMRTQMIVDAKRIDTEREVVSLLLDGTASPTNAKSGNSE